MKVHLFKNRLNEEFKMQCGYKIHGFNIDFYETIDHTKVTCEHCKKSQAYKDLKAGNELTQLIINDMEQIKNKTVADFKKNNEATKKDTYTQKIEIEVPNGYKFDKIILDNEMQYGGDCGLSLVDQASFFFKPKVKQGAELINCLCYLHDGDKNNRYIGIIEHYNEREKKYYTETRNYAFKFAYPVQADKLDQLKASLIRP